MVPQRPPTENTGQSSMMLFLALFLLLLAFFIILTAFSHFNTKRVDAVIRSLDETFRIDPDLLLGEQAIMDQSGPFVAARAAFNDVGDLFLTEISVAKIRRIDEGGVMVVSVPVNRLFGADGKVLSERTGLLQRISTTLAQSSLAIQYTVDIVQGVAAEKPEQAVTSRRLGFLARTLVERGAPVAAISVGTEHDDPSIVRFYFTARPKDEPSVDIMLPNAVRIGQGINAR